MKKNFPCSQCGACCRHVDLSELTAYLNRGDGVCRYYDQITHLCTIYDSRPEVCRIDQFYEQYLQAKIAWQDFVELNLIACKQLNEMES